jgi:hypothetical protein
VVKNITKKDGSQGYTALNFIMSHSMRNYGDETNELPRRLHFAIIEPTGKSFYG